MVGAQHGLPRLQDRAGEWRLSAGRQQQDVRIQAYDIVGKIVTHLTEVAAGKITALCATVAVAGAALDQRECDEPDLVALRRQHLVVEGRQRGLGLDYFALRTE